MKLLEGVVRPARPGQINPNLEVERIAFGILPVIINVVLWKLEIDANFVNNLEDISVYLYPYLERTVTSPAAAVYYYDNFT